VLPGCVHAGEAAGCNILTMSRFGRGGAVARRLGPGLDWRGRWLVRRAVIGILSTLVAAAVLGACVGCSFALDLDGYRVAASDAGGVDDGVTDVSVVAAEEAGAFRHYRFARGPASFEIDAASGLSADASGASAELQALSLLTDRGGGVELAADGSFTYTPPGAAGAFWGDDRFEYRSPAAPPAVRDVRLTVYPDALHPGELRASGGAGFGVAGAAATDLLGLEPRTFAAAGDVNGDGLQDFVVGNPGPPVDRGSFTFSSGRGAYVIFGKRDGTELSLADLGGTPPKGFAILGDGDESTPDSFGLAVGGAGDVNGDGLDDVIIGSQSFGLPDLSTVPGAVPGAAYVVFGKTDALPVSSAAIRAGEGGGFALVSSSQYVFAGYDVAGAGDVNGDGLSDVIVGGPSLGAADDSGAFVVFGKVGAEPVALAGIAAGGAAGFLVRAADADGNLGFSVAGGGDVNGDGLDDLVLGAPDSAAGDTIVLGQTAVVFGKRDSDPITFGELGTGSSHGFLIVGANDAVGGVGSIDLFSHFGHPKATGDVNGDGLDDIVVPAPFRSLASPSVAIGSEAVAPDAGERSDDAGTLVSPAHDLDEQGLVYVVFGQRDTRNIELDAITTGSGQGFVISGPELAGHLGSTVSSGDLNGDGASDVVSTTTGLASGGTAFVVFGKTDTNAVDLSKPQAPNAVLEVSDNGLEAMCGIVASGADVNGDGLDDLLVSAALYATAPQAAGGAYVAFGWDMTGALGDRDRALIGGSQDDVFDLPAAPVVIVRGGNGTDTLRVGHDTATLDLTWPGRYRSLEVIDVRGGGPQTVLLNDAALRKIPQNQAGFAYMLARRLTILGDAEDTLRFDMTDFRARGVNSGRTVYGKDAAYYGLEVSQDLGIMAP
jgi:hypothetical protein